jgi:hypothetical protein
MPGVLPVPPGVLVRRVVATADLTAAEALSKVNPAIATGDALGAFEAFRAFELADLVAMAARRLGRLCPRLRHARTQSAESTAHRNLVIRIGAGDEVRTRDMQLGRLPLYQLSYSRPAATS